MILAFFEIKDGENSYEQYSIFTKELTEREMIEEVYGYNEFDHRQYEVISTQDINEEEVKTLQKFSIAFLY
jgi:hypothetical protein